MISTNQSLQIPGRRFQADTNDRGRIQPTAKNKHEHGCLFIFRVFFFNYFSKVLIVRV
jgi:hypothetical protein